jgi:hypothetical protein
MGMSANVTLTGDGCTFEFSDWNMMMDVPKGGSLVDDALTLSGSGGWSSCTGTAEEKSMDVVCRDGCVFHMETN